MKKLRNLFLIVVTAIIWQGCLTSLHPLYTEKDIVFDKRLVGTWYTDDPTETWKFERAIDKIKDLGLTQNDKLSTNAYISTYTEKGKKAEVLVYLVNLGGKYYIDMYPMEMKCDNDLLADHYLPVHTFARINIGDKNFGLAYFNTKKIYELLNQNRIRIKHEKLETGPVITASTTELQQFVVKYADNKDFFTEDAQFKKLK